MKASDLYEGKYRPDLTPMIDVVFLLLIFFMVTTSLIKEEADLGIQLPTRAVGAVSDELPDRHIIDVMPDGSVQLNGCLVAGVEEQVELRGLIAVLQRIRLTSGRMGQEPVVVVVADAVSPHYKTVEVLDACAAARIRFVSVGRP